MLEKNIIFLKKRKNPFSHLKNNNEKRISRNFCCLIRTNFGVDLIWQWTKMILLEWIKFGDGQKN